MKADPALVKWAGREAKRRNDEILKDQMLPMLLGPRQYIHCLSMPAKTWIWERYIAEKTPDKTFTFVGIDHSATVFKKMEKVAGELNKGDIYTNATFIPLAQTSLKNVFEHTNEKFDIIYADWMGAWSFGKLSELEVLFRRDLLDPMGYLILTVSLNMRGSVMAKRMAVEYGRGAHEIYVKDDRQEFKELGLSYSKETTVISCRGIPKIVMEAAEKYGITLQPEPPHIYYNTHPHSVTLYPEASLCFRRVA